MDNSLYQEYLDSTTSPNSKDYQTYVLENNGGTFYKLTDEQKEEIVNFVAMSTDENDVSRLNTTAFSEGDYYYKPVIVGERKLFY